MKFDPITHGGLSRQVERGGPTRDAVRVRQRLPVEAGCLIDAVDGDVDFSRGDAAIAIGDGVAEGLNHLVTAAQRPCSRIWDEGVITAGIDYEGAVGAHLRGGVGDGEAVTVGIGDAAEHVDRDGRALVGRAVVIIRDGCVVGAGEGDREVGGGDSAVAVGDGVIEGVGFALAEGMGIDGSGAVVAERARALGVHALGRAQ